MLRLMQKVTKSLDCKICLSFNDTAVFVSLFNRKCMPGL